jgi:hypothetical protein
MSKHLLDFAEAIADDTAQRVARKLDAWPGGVDGDFVRRSVLRAFGCTCLVLPGTDEADCPLHREEAE